MTLTLQLALLCLGLVLLLQVTAAAQMPVTSVTIVEKAGVTTANYPITLSLVFKKGDVAGERHRSASPARPCPPRPT